MSLQKSSSTSTLLSNFYGVLKIQILVREELAHFCENGHTSLAITKVCSGNQQMAFLVIY